MISASRTVDAADTYKMLEHTLSHVINPEADSGEARAEAEEHDPVLQISLAKQIVVLHVVEDHYDIFYRNNVCLDLPPSYREKCSVNVAEKREKDLAPVPRPALSAYRTYSPTGKGYSIRVKDILHPEDLFRIEIPSTEMVGRDEALVYNRRKNLMGIIQSNFEVLDARGNVLFKMPINNHNNSSCKGVSSDGRRLEKIPPLRVKSVHPKENVAEIVHLCPGGSVGEEGDGGNDEFEQEERFVMSFLTDLDATHKALLISLCLFLDFKLQFCSDDDDGRGLIANNNEHKCLLQ